MITAEIGTVDQARRGGGEGPAHRAAKQTMLEEFARLGYGVAAEESHGDRRVDVAVTTRPGHRIAVELQSRPITPAEMQARMDADRRHGFSGTLWVWIGSRAAILERASEREARLPAEMRWLSARDRIGLFALRPDRTLLRYNLTTVIRWPDEDYNDWREFDGRPRLSPYRLKTMRRAWIEPCSFALAMERPPGAPRGDRRRVPSFRSPEDGRLRLPTGARRTLDAGGRL